VRPLRLDLEGFTSFRQKQTIDFSDLDLFAVTGPTGVGKSSIIDALVFALYGQVPRVGDDYKQLISHGAERLSVLLEFEVGPDRYRIARTARPAGASKQHLEQIEGGEAQPLADKAREIRARIEEILGLDYDGFTRAVVLPQGQFDEFLKGEPKERRKILVSLLGLGVYDAMQKLANQRGGDARKEARFVAEQLERDFADANPETLETRKRELTRAEEEAHTVEKDLAALREGLAVAQKLRGARREIDELVRDAVQEEKKLVKAEEVLARGDEALARLEAEGKALADQIDGLRFDASRHTALVAAQPRAEQLVGLREQLQRLERSRSEREAAIDRGRDGRETAEAAVPEAEKAREEAEAALAAAREAREEVHRQHAAVALRRELAAGEACPVCEQRVSRVPKGKAPALDTAEKRVASAEKAAHAAVAAAEKARLALQKAEAAAASLERELSQLGKQREEVEASARGLEHGLREAGFGEEDVADAARLLKRVRAELKTLDTAHSKRMGLEAKNKEISEKRAGLQAEQATATGRRDAARGRLDEIGLRREAASAVVDECLPALRTLASRAGWGVLEAGNGGPDELDVLESRRAAAQEKSREVASRVGALESEVERTDRKIVRATELKDKKAGLEADAALLKTLADHLRANELVAWIQEEALGRLAVDGSRHLAQLSQGRYELRLGSGEAAAGARAEQDFFVVDRWNADGVRSVKTLSGGETFLASLALALALAESLARLSAGGRALQALESLFLDEGFGTLDGETLDTVVSALDALHGGQRLVGVVTHVRELAERLPARLEVRRSAKTAIATVA
jgi:exonuclease SbcC